MAENTGTTTTTENGGTTEEGAAQEKEFTPITSQKELDSLVSKRVNRLNKKYADYDALKEVADKYNAEKDAGKSELEKLQGKIQKIEKQNAEYKKASDMKKWAHEISKESGVPAGILRGNTQEEMEAHAEALKPLLAQQKKETTTPYVANDGNQVQITGKKDNAHLFAEAFKGVI